MTQRAQLARATDAAFRASAARLQRLDAEEARLRETLLDLETRARDALLSAGAVRGLHGTGAAARWQDWLVTRRREVQIERAALLARRADLATRTTALLGRAEAAGTLARAEVRTRGERAEKADREAIAQLALLRAAQGRPGP